MKTIKLGNYKEKVILIDDEDFERVNKYNWGLYQTKSGSFNVMSTIDSKNNYLSRFILNYSGESQIDHRDRNVCNNQKSNLRFATNSQQGYNKVKFKNNISGYKGVNKSKEKYMARITVNGERKYLGEFRTAIGAAKAYNNAAILYHGEFACLNKIEAIQ